MARSRPPKEQKESERPGFWRRLRDMAARANKERVAYVCLGLIVLGVLAAGVLRAGLWHADEENQATFFRIATGATGGTYFRMGEILAGVVSSPPGSDPCELGGRCGVEGLIAVVKGSPGSVANVRNVASGIFESALVQANVLDAAYRGTGVFEDEAPRENLRVIANLYPEALHLVAAKDSGIESVADLAGKRVAIGSRGSGTWADARSLMAVYGINLRRQPFTEEDPSRAAEMLLAGDLDAFFMITGAPAPLIRTLILREAAHLVPISGSPAQEFRLKNAYYEGVEILEGTYPGVPEIETIGMGAMWVTREEVPGTLIYEMTRALFDERNADALQRGHPDGAHIDAEAAVRAVPIPFHPGAERYYFEAGILVR